MKISVFEAKNFSKEKIKFFCQNSNDVIPDEPLGVFVSEKNPQIC